MEKEEFLKINREFFKQQGFLMRTKNRFYHNSEELILCVWLQHSAYSKLYYINYDICLKALHPEIQEKLDVNICDVTGRLALNRKKCFICEYPLCSADDYLQPLAKLFDEQIVPILEKGVKFVKKLVKRNGAAVFYPMALKEKILSL